MNPQPKSSAGMKMFLSLGFIIVSGAYAAWQSLGGGQSTTTTTTPASDQQSTTIQIVPATTPTTSVAPVETTPTPVATTPPPTSIPVPVPAVVPPKPKGLYADGSYTGSAADAYYGMVQVKAIVQSGKLTDVQFLQYPNDRSTSIQKSRMAMPILTSEAIAAQSAKVDTVSGATMTSEAFIQSLSSALALAKN